MRNPTSYNNTGITLSELQVSIYAHPVPPELKVPGLVYLMAKDQRLADVHNWLLAEPLCTEDPILSEAMHRTVRRLDRPRAMRYMLLGGLAGAAIGLGGYFGLHSIHGTPEKTSTVQQGNPFIEELAISAAVGLVGVVAAYPHAYDEKRGPLVHERAMRIAAKRERALAQASAEGPDTSGRISALPASRYKTAIIWRMGGNVNADDGYVPPDPESQPNTGTPEV